MANANNAFDNRTAGKTFEELFLKQAQRNGLLCIKNHLTCRFNYNGRVQVIKGELDFKIINQKGVVGYMDCKSFQSDRFTFSEIDPDQLTRAVLYNDFKVPAGFIIWFRAINRVVFFSGHVIDTKGAKNHFTHNEGIDIGTFENFDLNLPLASYKKRGTRP